METLMLLGIVGSIGYYFKEKNPKEPLRNINEIDQIGFPDRQQIKPEIPLNRQPMGSNIYNSNMVESANNDVLNLSLQNYKDATNPSLTGILPPIYNSYSAVGTTNIIGNNDPTLKDLSDINNINRLKDVTATKQQPAIDTRPMFNPSTMIPNEGQNPFSDFGNMFSSNQETSLLTGLPLEREHNNAVPFFGGSVKQNTETFTNTSKLDSFTGNTSTFFHKQEVPQFFDTIPEYGMNGGTKTPLLTDQIELDRYIPSLYKQGEKPFYEERVQAPIAGTEYNPISKAAANFRTIDELRVGGDRQQESYAGRLKSGSNPVKNRGNIGSVAKNKNDMSFELGEDRWNTSVGAVINPKANENYGNMIQTSRQNQNIEYYGTGYDTQALKTQQRIQSKRPNSSSEMPQGIEGFDNSDEINFDSIFQDPIRQQLRSDTSRNINSVLNPNVHDYGVSSYNLPELERDTTKNNPLGNVNRSGYGQQIYNQDNPKDTIKQTTLHSDNSGNIVSVQKKSSNTSSLGTDYTFRSTNKESLVEANKNYRGTPSNTNPGMGYNVAKYRAKTTNGETVSKNNYHGHVAKNDGTGYNIANYDAKTTQGETFSKNKYNGHATDSNKNPMVYSTYDDPIKIRNAVHAKDYQGNSMRFTPNAENRQQYLNAEITETKEKLISGERPRGKNSSLSTIYNGDIGEMSVRDNKLFTEQVNNHTQNFDNISNNIPGIAQIGKNTQFYKGENSQVDQFSSNTKQQHNRFDGDLVKQQLKQNKYYNLQ
jgi:hypothetical protein